MFYFLVFLAAVAMFNGFPFIGLMFVMAAIIFTTEPHHDI